MKNLKYHMNIGGASVILLIAVFALTVFAVLSIRASYNEKRMAERNRDAVESYYAADRKAEEAYAGVVNAWRAAEGEKRTAAAVLDAAGIPEDVTAQAQEDCIICYVGVDYNRTLRLVLQLGETECNIKEWRLVSDSYGSYEEQIDLWDGVFTQ